MAASSANALKDTRLPVEAAADARNGFAPPEGLPRARGDVWEIPFAGADLFEVRQLVWSWASREALAGEATEELVLAVHEVATNSIRHGGGVGMLRLWRTGDELVCEIQDAGYIRDPLGPRREP